MARDDGSRVLLINPPLWNPYAPHLAIPLLLSMLRRDRVPATALDLAAESMSYLLSREGAGRYTAERRDSMTVRDRGLFEGAMTMVDQARAYLRTPESIGDAAGYRAATAVCQAVLNGLAAVTPGAVLEFDRFDLRYRPTRSRDVVRATMDPASNPYIHIFERLLIPRLRELPDLELIGLSVSADSQLIAALTAARIIKRERPGVHVTVGGNFITRIVPRLFTGHPFFEIIDSIVQYEGEDTILELADRIHRSTGIAGIPGIVVPDAAGLQCQPPSMVDLSKLPVPDFTSYPLADGYLAPGPVLPVIASRSCAWKCAFCAIPFASNKFRMRDPHAVVAELDELHRRHGISDFQFVDEILTVRTLRDLSKLLADRDYRWYGETRFSPTIDRRLTDAMYAAGCRRLDLGLESYNQDVLDRMHKDIRADWIEPNLDALLGSGVSIHLFGIAGFPGEARWQTARTVEFANSTVARSRREYGVPDSTFGIGPFVLDALSPVAANPAEFGVQVLHPDPSEDLQMALRYRYLGLLPEPATPAEFDAAARADKILSGRLDTVDHPPEEVLFLRAAQAGPSRQPASAPVLCLPPSWVHWPLRAADGWVSRRRRGNLVLLYEPGRGALVSLPARLFDRLPGSVAEICASREEIGQLEAGLRHGCLASGHDTTAHYLAAPADLAPAMELRLGEGVSVEHRAAEAGAANSFLVSRITGDHLRLSPGGWAVIQEIIRNGQIAHDELARLLQPSALTRLNSFLWRLLTACLLSVNAPVNTIGNEKGGETHV